MQISAKALLVLKEKAAKYFAESHGNHHAWVFGLDEEDPTTRELLDLKLVQRHGAGRSGHFRFSDVGHTVIVQNRSVEDGVEIAPQPARTSIHVENLTGHNVQVGHENQQTFNLTVEQLVDKVAASGDADAKTLLGKLLNNATVGALIGAGAAELLIKLFQ
jgi:hypothetical protein